MQDPEIIKGNEKEEDIEHDEQKTKPDISGVEKSSKKIEDIRKQESRNKQNEEDPDAELSEKLESNEKILKKNLTDKLKSLEGNIYEEGLISIKIDNPEGGEIPLNFDIDNGKLTVGEDEIEIKSPEYADFDKISFEDGKINIKGSLWGVYGKGKMKYEDFSNDIFNNKLDSFFKK